MLHITFTPSGAGILRQALRQQFGEAARGDRVIVLDDPLSIGPINPPDPGRRFEWMTECLGAAPAEWEGLPESADRFWEKALAAANPIVWVSRRSAAEYCGFLEWVFRRGEAPYDVVDLTEEVVERGRGPTPMISIGMVPPELVDVAGLIGRRHPPTAAERQAMTTHWRALKAEAANLRIVRDGEIVSVSDDHFDTLLCAAATSQAWTKAMRLVGEAMAKSDAATASTHYLYLEGRVAQLVKRGVFEARGNPGVLRRYEVRLAAAKSDSV